MSTGDLLEIQSSELKFPFEHNKQSSCCIKLTNKIDQYVAFKVKTTRPSGYYVRPNAGIVLPHTTCDVTVTMQARTEAPPNMQCKDSFLIQSVVANDVATTEDLTLEMFNKEPGKVLEEFKMPVVYVPVGPSSPIAEESEGGSSPRSPVTENGCQHSSLSGSVSTSLEATPAEKSIEMKGGDLLEIQSSELKFPFELKKQSSCCMQLTNKTDQCVAFKVKTTRPSKYCVRPNAGVILPRTTCDVTVTMQALMEAPEDMQCRDRFLIQSVVANDGATTKDLTAEMFNKEPGKVAEEFKMGVVYVPASPPLPVPEDSEEASSPWSSMRENGNKNSLFFNSVNQSPGNNESTFPNTSLEEHDEASEAMQRSTEQPRPPKQNDEEKWDDITIFSFEELEEATSGFSDSNKLGQGGFGSVYKGELLCTEVAIKMLNSQGDANQEKAFRQEVDILRRVSHPHLVRLMGVCPEKCALVYQFMHGGTLEDRLDCRDLPWQDRIRIATELCSALVFLHSRKPDIVVHGDLKPANVLLDAKGTSVLGDFGICRIISSSSNTTTLHITVTSIQGSNGYIDPAFTQSNKLQPSIDVYAFGMILLRLITNEDARFGLVGGVEDAMEEKLLEDKLDVTAEWPSQLAEELAKVAVRCCNYRPRLRPRLSEVYLKLKSMNKMALSAQQAGQR